MPKMTPGNRLYLYQLFSREIGVGRQTLLPRYEEALAADGLSPEDLGCADMRELCEQLGEFAKLTVFKKGYVYATVMANEEYDRALELLGRDEPKATGNKPWKRRKGAKALKPVKPRHVEKVVAPAAEPEPEPVQAPEPPAGEATDEATAPTEPVPAAAPDGDEADRSTPEPEAMAPEPAVEAEPEAEPEATPEPEAEPEPATKPSINLTITYVPEQPAAPLRTERTVPSAADAAPSGLPQDFYREVRCPDEQLSKLYQVLPPDVDPMATLEEDFRVARSTGAVGGTRSNAVFSLRYLRADGAAPVRVTLRRSARATAGKHWCVEDVDAGEPAEVGLEGLSKTSGGPWAAFLRAGDDADPERSFAQCVAIGSWERALQALAELAAPEDWGDERRVLRSYLTMVFSRARAQGGLGVSEDGSSACFDTGLLTEEGTPIRASLARAEGDIPWALTGFAADAGEGLPEPARYATMLAQTVFDPSVPAAGVPGVEALVRGPRLATAAYDPVADEVRLLVPSDGRALALAVTERGYEPVATLELPDAYACARVVSAEQPRWLRPARGSSRE